MNTDALFFYIGVIVMVELRWCEGGGGDGEMKRNNSFKIPPSLSVEPDQHIHT